jgi:hypothetical protein
MVGGLARSYDNPESVDMAEKDRGMHVLAVVIQ